MYSRCQTSDLFCSNCWSPRRTLITTLPAMTIPLDLYDPESSDSRFPPPTAPHPIIIIMIIKT
jgi:hypothetical protein